MEARYSLPFWSAIASLEYGHLGLQWDSTTSFYFRPLSIAFFVISLRTFSSFFFLSPGLLLTRGKNMALWLYFCRFYVLHWSSMVIADECCVTEVQISALKSKLSFHSQAI